MPLLLRKDHRCYWRDGWLGVWFLSCVPNSAAGAAQSPIAPLDSALTQREEFCPLSHQPSLLQLCLLLLVIHSSPNLCSRWELAQMGGREQSLGSDMSRWPTAELCYRSAVAFMGWTLCSPQGELTLEVHCSLEPPQTWPGCFGQIAELKLMSCKSRTEQPEECYCLPPTSSGNVRASQKRWEKA